MAMATVTVTKTLKPSKATAPAMVTWAPWVWTWSHWKRAATRAATEVTDGHQGAGPHPQDPAQQRGHHHQATAPPIMIRMGRMLR